MASDLSDLQLPDPIIPTFPRSNRPSDGAPRPLELHGQTARTLDPWTTTRAGDPLLELEGWGWDADGRYDDLIEVSEVLRASVRSAPASRPDEWRINTIAPFIKPEDRSYWDPTISQQLALSPYIQRRMATTKANKEAFLREVAAGRRVAEACEAAGIKGHTYARWRRDDPQFTARVDNIRAGLADELTFTHDSFVSRRKYFFGYDTFAHHQLMNDAIEATPDGGVTLILLPPEAGKTTFVEDFLSDRIAHNPSDRILYVSDRAGEGSMAQKVLSTLKDRFTDPHVYDPNAPQARIAEFIARFGPFHDDTEDRDKPWNANYIKVHKASGRRDYTFQACGWRSKVYGARADLLICDDIQSEESLGQTDQILRRLRKTFFTRARRGKVIIIGTRIGIGDVYERLIEEGVVSEGGLVLIPALDSDGNSYCPEMWSVEQLEATKQIVGDEAWTTAYMMAPQEAADATFPLELIETCFRTDLNLGVDALKGTDDGTWRRIAHLDPALGGGNALWVSTFNQHYFRPIDLFLDYKLARNEDIFSRIKEACRYHFEVLVVEKNAQQKGIARDDRLRELADLFGFEIVEHQTGSNKWDPMWGIRSMATSFVRREFQIPWGDEWTQKRLKPYIDQLIAWRAGVSPKVQRQDTVLSEWFGWLYWVRERDGFSTDTSAWSTRGTLWKPGDMGAGWGRGGWQRPNPTGRGPGKMLAGARR